MEGSRSPIRERRAGQVRAPGLLGVRGGRHVVSLPEISSPDALECRECHTRYPVEPLTICEECFGPLEPAYDLGAMDGVDFRKHVEAGPATLWRYEGLLPGGPGIDRVDLGAGFTPLRRADRLGDRLGIERLWVKDDSVNPSNSFKDRVVSVAIHMAKAFGFEAVSCASTGNLANATAAHAAKAGMPAFVFVPEDLEPPKILATEAYGAKVVAVKGSYDDVNRLCTEVAEALPWAFINVNLRPYYAEGSKSLGFEVAEQLGWRLPDHVVVPVASGALMIKVHRAFRELVDIAAVEDRPYRISGAQAEGCAPEAEVVAGVRLLAETEGVFTETAGGVTVAVLKRLRDSGAIGPEDETVAMITGNGYKTVSALEGVVEPTYRVGPSLDEIIAALRG